MIEAVYSVFNSFVTTARSLYIKHGQHNFKGLSAKPKPPCIKGHWACSSPGVCCSSRVCVTAGNTETHREKSSNVLDHLTVDWGWADDVMSQASLHLFGGKTQLVKLGLFCNLLFFCFCYGFESCPDYNHTYLSQNTHPHLWKRAEDISSYSATAVWMKSLSL